MLFKSISFLEDHLNLARLCILSFTRKNLKNPCYSNSAISYQNCVPYFFNLTLDIAEKIMGSAKHFGVDPDTFWKEHLTFLKMYIGQQKQILNNQSRLLRNTQGKLVVLFHKKIAQLGRQQADNSYEWVTTTPTPINYNSNPVLRRFAAIG